MSIYMLKYISDHNFAYTFNCWQISVAVLQYNNEGVIKQDLPPPIDNST